MLPMQPAGRRRFIRISILALAVGAAVFVRHGVAGPPGEFSRNIDRLRLTNTKFIGGYRLQKDDGRINWYFTNLGLMPLCEGRSGQVREYLDLYLRSTQEGKCTIQDIRNLATGVKQTSDSDDSYAATFLSLACNYVVVNSDEEWRKANLAGLKSIGRKVLLKAQKPSGLVSVFVADETRAHSFLMDNCEVYRGLADLADLLARHQDPDEKEFRDAAVRVAGGVAGLFDEERGAFRVADIEGGTEFYPLRAAQVFPEVFGVPLGDAVQTRNRYDAAWNFMNATGDRWERGKVKDGSLGGYPWMILGYAAAKHGEFDLARVQLKSFKKELRSPVVSSSYTAIHELGWAIRTMKLLDSQDR